MEIEFSPNQPSAARAERPVKAAAAAPPPAQASQPEAPQGVAELQRKLNDLALTRPDKMDAMRAVISDVKYPPEELLNGIAHLLAIKLSQ